MYSFTMSEAGASDVVWNAVCAAQELDVAIEAMEEVAAAFSGLVHDTQWQADGVRALRERIASHLAASESEIGALHTRAAEVDRMLAS